MSESKLIEPQSIWAPDFTKYAVLDTETTVKAPDVYKFKAHPAWPTNSVVAWGAKLSDQHDVQLKHVSNVSAPIDIPGDVLLVGHNIKFDLQYIHKANPKVGWPVTPIWDTGIAHYMMTGQKGKMPSLNEVAEFYGLGQKETGVSDLWDMGVQTEDIEPSVLLSYLKQDVLLTEGVFKAQMERLNGLPKLRDHIMRVSTASTFLAVCEYTGLPVNPYQLGLLAGETHKKVDAAKASLYDYAEKRYNIPVASRELWDPTTPKNVGRLLFDMPLDVEDWEPAGRVLKSGAVAKRRRKIEVSYTAPSDELNTAIRALSVPRTMSGAIQTSDDLLDALASCRGEVVEPIKAYRASSKLLSTYIDPIAMTIGATYGAKIHPSFHITTTNTGRSSSSGPNAQQFPPEIEKVIHAQFSGYNYMVKADFKQLQICGVAMLSGDPQLIDDLNSGRDVHYETGKVVFGWKAVTDMNKEDRRVVKNTNFGLIFGGKATGLAKQTGVSKALVQQCIDAFYDRYPKVKEWVDKNVELVERIAVPAEGEFINGEQVRESFLQTPAGRILRFSEHEVPEWVRRKTGRSIGFSPNEVANYPVQAYTDGDLALIYLAILARTAFTKFLPVNFVHDSVWVLTNDVEGTKLQLLNALNELNTKMGLSVPLSLEFTVEDVNGVKVG